MKAVLRGVKVRRALRSSDVNKLKKEIRDLNVMKQHTQAEFVTKIIKEKKEKYTALVSLYSQSLFQQLKQDSRETLRRKASGTRT